MKTTKKRKQSSNVNLKTKNKKKLKDSKEPISSLCNVIGISPFTSEGEDPFTVLPTKSAIISSNDVDDLESCLALMDQPLNEKNENKTSIQLEETSEGGKKDGSTNNSNDDDNLWKGHDDINENMRTLQKQCIREEFHLPNIQIELARHKHVGELSQFLLSKCPKLRMPSFERWLIDSKMEERAKRSAIQETKIRLDQEADIGHVHQHATSKEMKWKQRMKRKQNDLKSSLDRHMTSSGMRTLNDYDFVIPTMADIDDESTQRLIQEIKTFSDDDVDNHASLAQNICRELCQKSCTAARHLQNLNHHLGGPIHVNQYLLQGKKSGSKSIGRILLNMDDDLKVDGATSSSSQDDTNEKKPVTKTYSLVYSRKNKNGIDMKPFVVKINSQHYDKLREMFNFVHDDNHKLHVPSPTTLKRERNYTPATKIFHHLVFCMLVRYAALSGGQQLLDLRGGGMQVSYFC